MGNHGLQRRPRVDVFEVESRSRGPAEPYRSLGSELSMRGRWLNRRFARSMEGARSCSVRRRDWRIVVDCQPTSLLRRALVNALSRSKANSRTNTNARAWAVDRCSASAWMIRSWGSPDGWSGLTAAPTALTNHAVHRSGVRVFRFEHTTPSPPGDGRRSLGFGLSMRGRWLNRRFARSMEGTRSCSVRRSGWRIVVDCQPTSLLGRTIVNTLGRSRAKGCSNANPRACAVDCCSASAWMIRSWGSPDAWSGLTAAPTALTNHAVHRSGVRVVRFEHTTPSPPGDGRRCRVEVGTRFGFATLFPSVTVSYYFHSTLFDASTPKAGLTI